MYFLSFLVDPEEELPTVDPSPSIHGLQDQKVVIILASVLGLIVLAFVVLFAIAFRKRYSRQKRNKFMALETAHRIAPCTEKVIIEQRSAVNGVGGGSHESFSFTSSRPTLTAFQNHTTRCLASDTASCLVLFFLFFCPTGGRNELLNAFI